jgi:hypothetical protein
MARPTKKPAKPAKPTKSAPKKGSKPAEPAKKAAAKKGSKPAKAAKPAKPEKPVKKGAKKKPEVSPEEKARAEKMALYVERLRATLAAGGLSKVDVHVKGSSVFLLLTDKQLAKLHK